MYTRNLNKSKWTSQFSIQFTAINLRFYFSGSGSQRNSCEPIKPKSWRKAKRRKKWERIIWQPFITAQAFIFRSVRATTEKFNLSATVCFSEQYFFHIRQKKNGCWNNETHTNFFPHSFNLCVSKKENAFTACYFRLFLVSIILYHFII